ncbi:MAG: non-canonical purine NTP pyrophosphatase [Ktedonobacteraceae bacterium]
MKKVYFLTTNAYKFKKFSELTHSQSILIEQLSEVTPEIQAKNNREVAEFSAKWAADKFGLPVIKEDVGMYIEALGGFPGVYLNQIENWIGSEGYLRLLKGIHNRSAFWEYAIAYCEPDIEPVSFYTYQHGGISTEIKGESGYYADKIFIPKDCKKTIAELLDSGTYIRNDSHYIEMLSYVEQNADA